MSHNLPKVVLVDADGVLIRSSRPYSHQHAEEHSIEASQIEPFFHGKFRLATVGKADLKELIREHRDLWAWDRTPEELLERWFKAEGNIDQELLGILQQLRQAGVLVYLATDQEKYRVAYMRDVMFLGTLDGVFVSCELGFEKKQPEFFQAVLQELTLADPRLTPADVLFFDDSQGKVDSALAAGIRAELYTSPNQVQHILL